MSPQDKPSNSPAGKGGSAPKSGPPASGAPQGGTGTKAGGAPRRMSREASLALVLLPVLLVAGFLLGGQLLSGDDGTTAAAPAAAPTSSPDEGAGTPTEQPTEQPTEEPAEGPDGEVAGPALPEPADTPEPAAEPEPEPTQAPEPEPTQAPEPEPTQEPAPAPAPTQEPAAPGPTTADGAPTPTSISTVVVLGIGSVDPDVRTYQQRMADRGWAITVDGIYGPQTASVTRAFQAEKGLAVDGLVGLDTYNAAWDAPIT